MNSDSTTLLAAAAFCAAVLTTRAAAQAPGAPAVGQERVVQVTVTSVGDHSVYLDHGRDAGLQPGTLVRLFAPGAGDLEVEVRSVSSTSARAELPPGVSFPPVGTRGEAQVTIVAAPSTTSAPSPQPAVPAHPPWARREDPRAPNQPLLVPTYGQRPEDRPATLDGRLFASGQWTHDEGANRQSDYLLLRAGVRADATNHLGAAERVRFAGEFDDRRTMLQDAPDRSDTNGRIDLLSVALGTEAWAPTGFEVGRMYSQYLPEIGLLDGVEVVQRLQGGMRLGGGIGSYPVPFPSRDTGEDIGAHLFFDYTADARRSFAGTVGAQKTWHKGSADRDLLLLRGEWRPAEQIWLLGSAKVDFYTGGDTLKSGADLTEVMLQARWDGRATGTGVVLSHFTWPELKRAEYQFLPADLITDGYVDRASWNGAWRPSNRLSLRVRADLWRDQDREGTGYGLDTDWRGPFGDSSALSLSLFQSDGGFTTGPGVRVLLRDRIGALSWRLGYRWHRYELRDLVTGPETYTRQSAELGLSMPISHSGDLDLSLERWFGDSENTTSLGFYMQWRF
jgi:hypothetical protein